MPQDNERSDQFRNRIIRPGHHLHLLRQGEPCPYPDKNPYLMEAVEMRGELFTLEEIQGRPQTAFSNHAPVILEIGCYMGLTLAALARENPGLNFLGVDIKYKRVVKSLRRGKREGLNNLRVMIADGMDLLEALRDETLQGCLVFYPDPWHKKRQQRKRLLTDLFVEELERVLVPGGFVWLKTDHTDYFEVMRQRMAKSSLREVSSIAPYLADKPYPTFFETLFSGMGKPANSLICTR